MADKTKKIPHIKPVNNFALLFVLTLFQGISGIASAASGEEFSVKVLFSMGILIFVEWAYVEKDTSYKACK